jgi:pimeloyl-ACP methyl ester carboxylesterase
MTLLTSVDLASRCAGDGEFQLAARYWTGGLRLEVGDDLLAMRLVDGVPSPGDPGAGDGVITLGGPVELWRDMLAPIPPRFANDVSPATALGLRRTGDGLLWWQYVPAIQRAIELLRDAPDTWSGTVDESGPTPRLDAPVGRYLHLDLDRHDHRVYFEEAGQGIPLLLQHTAGSHGVQWRHLFECGEITDHFRLIAYDLPFHGKSIPPVTRRWWEQQYRLTGSFLRQVPVALAEALELDRPVFMGCSVGGLLALDLALHHPDRFGAVVSVEGALDIADDWSSLTGFWHPQVSNDTKARMMEGLTSPTSPAAYRKETIQSYAAGWPQVFLGDLWYYFVDYDLSERVGEIDTDQVAVHILSGEYDYSAPPELGMAVHDAIRARRSL